MKTIVFVACSGKKVNKTAKAKDLYTSPLFRLSMKVAQRYKPDEIFLLSAKHYLVELERELAPYDQKLERNKKSREPWIDEVVKQIINRGIQPTDKAIFLTGKEYFFDYFNNPETPLHKKRLGFRLQWLSNEARKG